jgi:RNA methyltransferase, TrmH family
MLVSTQAKYIQSLGHKKFRDADGVFVAEGPKIVLELIHSDNCRLVQCFATADWFRSNEMNLKGKENLLVEVNEKELERISTLVTPHQVLGIFTKPVFINKPTKNNMVLLLDTIQDPGNFGTILRTADWFGIRMVVASMDSADAFNQKVVQSAMGSLIRVEMLYTDLEKYIRANPHLPVFASSLDGEDLSDDLETTNGMLLLGNESRGISQPLENLATKRIRIPRYGNAESLNVAVAAGILLSRMVGVNQN